MCRRRVVRRRVLSVVCADNTEYTSPVGRVEALEQWGDVQQVPWLQLGGGLVLAFGGVQLVFVRSNIRCGT